MSDQNSSKQWCDVHGTIPEHGVCACDYENIGRAVMEAIARNLPDYSWSECPSEVIVDLINERDDARASLPLKGPLTLDNDDQVFFYEQDHYYLSNFSAFCLRWRGETFLTSEHAYHWARFELPEGGGKLLQFEVQHAFSAHEAFKFAQRNKDKQRLDWDSIKVGVMHEILRAKVDQHEYVRRKLLETGDRELIENSWRDDFWGWGENRDGKNALGKLWMEIRRELRAQIKAKEAGNGGW